MMHFLIFKSGFNEVIQRRVLDRNSLKGIEVATCKGSPSPAGEAYAFTAEASHAHGVLSPQLFPCELL